jgi:hypothetical protein
MGLWGKHVFEDYPVGTFFLGFEGVEGCFFPARSLITAL